MKTVILLLPWLITAMLIPGIGSAQLFDRAKPNWEFVHHPLVLQYLKRVAQSYEAKLTPEINGDELTVQLENETALAAIRIGMLLPAMQQARGVAGEGMVFDGQKGTTFPQIRDGLSNTIVIVEANPERAEPWTKPQDYHVDPRNPLAGLGSASPNGFIASLADVR